MLGTSSLLECAQVVRVLPSILTYNAKRSVPKLYQSTEGGAMVIDEDDEGRSSTFAPLFDDDEAPPTPSSSALPYFIPRRPRVIRMRDLSPDTRAALTKEYFDAYDPWTGARIAATLGLFISLFALFLAYKSRFHSRQNASTARHAAKMAAAKTSLYLYEDDDISISSSVDSIGGLAEGAEPLPGFHLQQVYMGGGSSVVAALKVKRSSYSSKGTSGEEVKRSFDVEEGGDAFRSLPCSPLKDEEGEEVRSSQQPGPQEMVDRTRPTRLEGHAHECGKKHKHKHGGRSQQAKGTESVVVVVAKKPHSYRNRNTIVSIARRQRLFS
ncbi:hypothetical protein JTE90_011264 [Oedothorax gibbosus]|uniref:Transmembrane protein n=1 Tax=Oedothorax gibbosus TaxID=931172 RepID=A0AAV6TXW4_9ARAC|nr:hypothetical protein JTE90_011264 [Oedothorax gibbosus]